MSSDNENGFDSTSSRTRKRMLPSVAEIAREYQVHPTQVSQWKRAIVERLPEVFEHGATAQAEASEREVARLEQKVGQLTMELDWLKKKSKQLGL